MNIKALFFFLSVSCINPIWSQHFKLGKPSDSLILQKKHPAFPEAQSAILEKSIDFEISENYNGEFILSQTYKIRLKTYGDTKDSKIIMPLLFGEEVSKTKAFIIYTENEDIVKERLGKENIRVTKNKNGTSVLEIDKTNIKGSIIDYTYTIKSNFIDVLPKVFFQDYIPVDKVNYTLNTPKYLGYIFYKVGIRPYNIFLNGKPLNLDKKKSITTAINSSSNNTYQINLTKISPYPKQEIVGSFANFASGIKMQLGYIYDYQRGVTPIALSWEEFSQMLYEREDFGKQLEERAFLEEIATAFKTSYPNPVNRLNAIFEYVQQRMQWNGNYNILTENGVKSSFLGLEGNVADINFLLINLLKASGVEATPVLVSTKSNGLAQFPSLYSFDYILVKSKIGNKDYLLDASSKLTGLETLEIETMNIQGLEIYKNEKPSWISLYPNTLSTTNIFTQLYFEEDKLKGDIKTRYAGISNLEEKRNLKDHVAWKTSAKNDTIEYSNLNVIDFKIEGLEDPNSYLKKTVLFEEPTKYKNNQIVLDLSPFFYRMNVQLNTHQYNLPLDLNYGKSIRQIINITIPEKYDLQKYPKDFEVSSENTGVHYILKFKKLNRTLQVTSSIKFSKPIITPMYQADLKKQLDTINRYQEIELLLTKS